MHISGPQYAKKTISPEGAPLEVTLVPADRAIEFTGLGGVKDSAEKKAPDISRPTPEDILHRVEEVGIALRGLIVDTKKLAPYPGLETHQHPTRSLALAQENLQTGLMWLRRAIRPEKIF